MPSDNTNSKTPEPKAPEPRTGNRCGHDPSAPRWFTPPPEHEDRPPIIRRLIERAKAFYHEPAKIPSLARALVTRKVEADPAAEHKPRKMRSERREACCALMGAIAHYCDLPSLCLSVPQDDGSLLPLPLETLADRAGLGLRRAERAMRDIVTGGLLKVYPRCEQREDGTYRGRAAIRVVPPSVFGLFGLEGRLEHDRRRISQKRREERGTPTKTATARIRVAVGGVLEKITGRRAHPTPPVPAAANIPEVSLQVPAPAPAPALIQDLPHASFIATMLATLTGQVPEAVVPAAPAALDGGNQVQEVEDQPDRIRRGGCDPP